MAFSASRSGTGPENSLAGWLWRWARKAHAAGFGSGIWVSFAPRTGDKARRRQAGLPPAAAPGRRRPRKRGGGRGGGATPPPPPLRQPEALTQILGCRLGPFDPVAALGQVQRRAQVVDLRQGQGNPHRLIRARVNLFDHHAFGIGLDDDIFLQGGWPLVDQGDYGRVKVVLYGEHSVMLGRSSARLKPEGGGVSLFGACPLSPRHGFVMSDGKTGRRKP